MVLWESQQLYCSAGSQQPHYTVYITAGLPAHFSLFWSLDFILSHKCLLLFSNLDKIHLGFSSNVRDPRSHWEEVMLHDIDVLVALLQALLPSDIQKVRAVFWPELRVYRHVVIFLSKSYCVLAENLSGGDYEGDRAWVFWEPRLVEPF